MKSLMDIYRQKYGGDGQDKMAASDTDDLLRQLGIDDEDRGVKLAAAYDELGRRLARETFAAEVLGADGETEKTADEDDVENLLAEVAGQPQEKTASDEVADKFLAALTEEVGEDEVKLAEIKEAALREMMAKILNSARAGGVKAKAFVSNLLAKARGGGAKARALLRKGVEGLKTRKREVAVGGAGAAAGAGGGALATYLAMRGKKEKK